MHVFECVYWYVSMYIHACFCVAEMSIFSMPVLARRLTFVIYVGMVVKVNVIALKNIIYEFIQSFAVCI